MHSSESTKSQFDGDRIRQSPGEEAWRAEVASRVSSYRARRRRKGDEDAIPSLDFGPGSPQTVHAPPPVQRAETRRPSAASRNAFDTNYYRRLNAESIAQVSNVNMGATAAAQPEADFEVEENLALYQREPEDEALNLELRPPATDDAFLDRYCISDAAEPELFAPAGNLLVFRRPVLEPPLMPQPSRDELAEPMNNRPRILEVPEDIMPTVQGSLFPEIRLDADLQEVSCPEPEIEVPRPVAKVTERVMAALTDIGMVGTAGLVFSGMAWRALPEVPHGKPFWMIMGAATVLFWTVYQHLFLLYAGRTPGMRRMGIRLSTFDGHAPQWVQRRRRARYMIISVATVGLGFLSAFFDESRLCWHDRLSQTFPTLE